MLTPKRIQRIYELDRQGVSASEIARNLGIARETVRRYLGDPGLRGRHELPVSRGRSRKPATVEDSALIEARRRLEQKRLELEEREVDASLEELFQQEQREREQVLWDVYWKLRPPREGLA